MKRYTEAQVRKLNDIQRRLAVLNTGSFYRDPTPVGGCLRAAEAALSDAEAALNVAISESSMESEIKATTRANTIKPEEIGGSRSGDKS